VRLVTDRVTADQVLTEFENADPQLVLDVAVHAELQFVRKQLQTRRIIRELGPAAVAPELIDAAAGFLEGMLRTR